MVKQALGRGLGALMGGNSPSGKPSTPAAPTTPTASTSETTAPTPNVAMPKAGGESVYKLAVSRIFSCSFQPRQQFDEPSLEELAQSIKEQGILQPILVRPMGENYEIIAGERRWRAAQKAGLTEVPVVVKEASDVQVMEWALIENLQRDNLNPIEEALGYAQLINKFNLRQEDAAQKVGKSRAAVTNAIRLLNLPPPVQDYLRSNLLSVGHAKALLGLASPEAIRSTAEKIIREGL
ncbi:MAG: ParB/RepB/Spo0J family partition protein, partial [Verrucomicrobiales bacterium]